MEIIEKATTTLKLQSTSTYSSQLKIAFISLICATGFLFGLLSIIFFGELTTITCQRTKSNLGNCDINTSSLLIHKTKSLPISKIQGAGVSINDDPHGIYYSVNIAAEHRGDSLVHRYNSMNANNQALKLNSFIHNSDHELLRIQQDNRLLNRPSWYLFWATFFCFMVLQIFRLKHQDSCVFDKDLCQIHLKQHCFFMQHTELIPLHDVERVQGFEETDEYGFQDYKSSLVLKSGEQIGLQISGSPSAVKEAIRTINQFINV